MNKDLVIGSLAGIILATLLILAATLTVEDEVPEWAPVAEPIIGEPWTQPPLE